MAKRFGRNQRRALRDSLRATIDEATRQAQLAERREAELQQQLQDARRAGNTIRIDVDAMLDDRERSIRITAAFDMARRDRLFSAIDLDRREIDRRSNVERAAFIEHAGKIIAEQAMHQVLRHWRSR